MNASIIRGKYVVCKAIDRHACNVIEDGALYQSDGTIVEVGTFVGLRQRYENAPVFGSARNVVIPGLVNSHHHVGLTPFQLGAPDLPLEVWGPTRLAARDVDLYLDTLYSAFEMIESGVTTVQHLHGRVKGPIEKARTAAETVLRAYADIGMRVSYSLGIRDQNRFTYDGDERFIESLDQDLKRDVRDYIRQATIPADEVLGLFSYLYGRYNQEERIRIQLAPTNLHWCSDGALIKVREHAERYRVPIHMHLLETRYQREYAHRRWGRTAVEHLHDLGFLSPALTLGHGVWMTEDDIGLAAEAGVCICHNASSNLRLRSGLAPLNAYEARGMRVAIGIDEAGINDDRDMLQEMRLVLNLHRTPGLDESVPTPAQVFRMATEHGAHTTPYGPRIGTIETGKAADAVLLNWEDLSLPYLEGDTPVVEAVLRRARSGHVETVIVAGEPVFHEHRFTRVDKEEVMKELARSLRRPLTPEEAKRREMFRKMVPSVRRFFEDYPLGEELEPFFWLNSRR